MSGAGYKELPAYHPWREGRIESLGLILARMPEDAAERAELVEEREALCSLVERQQGLRRVQYGRFWFKASSSTRMTGALLIMAALALVGGTGWWIANHLR